VTIAAVIGAIAGSLGASESDIEDAKPRRPRDPDPEFEEGRRRRESFTPAPAFDPGPSSAAIVTAAIIAAEISSPSVGSDFTGGGGNFGGGGASGSW